MIRCIEEAIKQGAITREEGRKLQERIDGLLDEGLGGADIRSRISTELAANAKEARRRALLMEAKRKVLTEVVLNHRNPRGENDPAQALWLLLDDTAQLGVNGIETKRLAIIGDAHRQLDDILMEFRKGWLTGDLRRRSDAQQASMRSFVREIFGEDSGDPRAKELAKAWTEVTEGLRQRSNKAGTAIGKLENWGMPQIHNREALLKAGRETWVDYMMQPGRLDRERMAQWLERPTYTDAELREALGEAWKSITSDGAFGRDPGYGGPGKGALARRFDGRHRWLHFANADEWLAYQKAFGEGDPFRTMMQHINLSARDIATLETLGPNPEAMRNYLKSLVQKTAAEVEPASAVLKNEMVQLRQLIERSGTGEVGRAALERIEGKIADLGHLRRKARAEGASVSEGEPGRAARDLEAAIRDLGKLESQVVSERRAALEREMTRLDGLIADIERKGAPKTVNVPAETRKRIDKIGALQRETEARRAAADTLSTVDVERLDQSIALLRDPSGVVEPRDILPFFRIERGDTEIARRLDRVRRGLGRRYEAIVEDWFSPEGGQWFPKAVRERLLAIDSTPEMVAYLEGLRWGGLVEARQKQLDDVLGLLARERAEIGRAMPLAAVGLSRRNRRRVADLTAERAAAQQRLDALTEASSTLEETDPQLMRALLARIRSAQQATDEVAVIGTDAGFLAVAKPQDAARVAIDKHDRLWELGRGTYFAPVNTWWADGMQNLRNLATAHMLGSAPITAIADISTQRVARKMAGMSGNLLTVTRGVFRQWSHASRREAVRSGLIVDEAMHVASQEARFVEGIDTVTWTGYFADRVLSLSGLSWMTQAGKHAFGLGFQGHIADSLHMDLAALAKADPNLERVLRRNGFSDADWEMMRASQVHEPRPGARFLRPSEVGQGAGGDELAEKYLRMTLRMTRMAVVEGTPEARIMWGGGRPGTFIGEISRNMAQFKSYSAGYMLLHLRNAMHTAQAGRKWDAAMHTGNLVLVGTVMGALAIDLNELTNGRDPLFASALAKGEVPDWKQWGKAFMKSGGFGIYGDFLFQSTDFLARGTLETLAGPVPGTFERNRKRLGKEIENTVDGKMDGTAAARAGFNLVRDLTPGTSLWYAKKLINTYVFDQLDYMLDPTRAERAWRQSERMRKRGGGTNETWWKRGELAPERAPSLVSGAP